MLSRIQKLSSRIGCGTHPLRWRYNKQRVDIDMKTKCHLSNAVGAMDELERTFVRPSFLCDVLRSHQIDFYCGVPDSLLKDFCGYVSDKMDASNHRIVTNEALAIALASGYHLETGRIATVYLQNSGLGNAVNPFLSLTHQNVYSIPMLLMIGWRGEIGKKDEPQHTVTGEIMCDLLKLMKIPYDILPDYEEGIDHCIQSAIQYMRRESAPYALVVRKRTFETYEYEQTVNENGDNRNALTRKQALDIIVDNVAPNTAFVSSTGFASRELNECRQRFNQQNECDDIRDFLSVGSMGCASSIALGAAMNNKERNIVCIDGDGAALMHLGAMSMIGNSDCLNMKHILINNGCHDSVGAQSTNAEKTNFLSIAKACGYKQCKSVSEKEEIIKEVQNLHNENGPYFLEIKSKSGVDKKLSRPKTSPKQNKHDFMSFLNKTK